MKIIKHGSTYIEPQTIECTCGCKFEIEDSDVNKSYLKGIGWFYYVTCPECGTRKTIERVDKS